MMHKLEEKDFRIARLWLPCYRQHIYNGLNKIENCHLYQEKELRIEQQALRNMHNELSNVFDTMSDGDRATKREGSAIQPGST